MADTLNYTEPDFTQLVVQLQNKLAAQSAWKDTYRSGTGQMLLELHAFVGNMLLYYVERRASELYIGTAQLQSSLFNIVRLLGYQPYTATSATGLLTFYSTLDSALPVVIAPGTVVQSPAGYLYTVSLVTNPAVINSSGLANGVTLQAVEGSQQSVQVTSAGTPDQSVQINDAGVDYSSIRVMVNGILWEPANSLVAPSELATLLRAAPEVRGLLDTLSQQPGRSDLSLDATASFLESDSGSQIYQVSTLAGGGVQIDFGDGIFGSVPPSGQVITVNYRLTDGSVGNIFADTGVTFTVVSMGDGSAVPDGLVCQNGNTAADAGGLWGGTFIGGADAETLDSIRANAPQVFKTGDRAVTKADYIALLESYPCVRSANVWGEAEELVENPAGQVLGTGDGSTKDFFAVLSKPPAVPGTLLIQVAGLTELMDNGGGVLVDAVGYSGGSGTINYVTGEMTAVLPDVPMGGQTVTALYDNNQSLLANRVKIALLGDGFQDLTAGPASTAFLAALTEYLRQKSVLTVLYEYVTANVLSVVPRVLIRAIQGYQIVDVQLGVQAALAAQFVLGVTVDCGTPIRLSQVYAAVKAVLGVSYARVDLYLQRELRQGSGGEFTLAVADPLVVRQWVPEFCELWVNGVMQAKDDGEGDWIPLVGSPYSFIGTLDGGAGVDYVNGLVGVDIIEGSSAPPAGTVVTVMFQQQPMTSAITPVPTGETGDIVPGFDQVCEMVEAQLTTVYAVN